MNWLEAGPPTKAGSRRAWLASGAALFAVGVCLYARTLDYQFVNWDDIDQVVENPWIRSFSLEHFSAIFSRPVLDAYFPLMSVSFMLDYALWGLDPRGYHLQSVLLNALNGALAFWVIARLSRRPLLAFIAALLWSVHHTHVEAVAWVSARKEVLATALLLLSLATYLRARRTGILDRRAYAASVVLFGLGTAAKVTSGSYLLFFLLVDWFEDARIAPERRRTLLQHVSTKLPYLAVALPSVSMNLLLQRTSGLGVSDALEYALVRGQAGWRYLWLLLGVRMGQPFYDPPPISRDPVLVAATLAPLFAPPIAFAFALRRGHGQVAMALAWLMIGLLAPLVFPLVIFMADRYLYAPSLGFCWMLAAGILRAAIAPARSRAWNAMTALLLTAPALAWFTWLTWSYTPVWKNSETLWRHGVATSRDSHPPAALASELIKQRRYDEAERVLTGAPVLASNGYLQLAMVYLAQNRYGEALRASDRSLVAARTPPSPPAYIANVMWIRGLALAKLDRPEEAVEAWKEALTLDPDNSRARAALDDAER